MMGGFPPPGAKALTALAMETGGHSLAKLEVVVGFDKQGENQYQGADHRGLGKGFIKKPGNPYIK